MNQQWKKRQGAKLRLAAKHSTAIQKAIKDSVDLGLLVTDFFFSHSTVPISTAEARTWVRMNARSDTKELFKALTYLYADSYILGEDIGMSAIAKASINKAPTLNEMQNALAINWSTWQPGNRAAAALVNPKGGLERLLSHRGLTISGITTTTYDRIGTQLAYALERGLAPSAVSPQIADLIQQGYEGASQALLDPERALMIAQTEMSSAVSVAARGLYQESGVELVEWLVADPCDECQENADASPIRIDEVFPTGDTEPPAHPNCVCDLSPYVLDTRDLGEQELEDRLGGGDAQAVSLNTDSSFSDLTQLENASSVTIADTPKLLQQMSFQRELGFYDNASVPASQSNALNAYVSNSYLNIQSVMREGKVGLGSTSPEHLAQIKQAADNLQTLIKSAPSLQNDILTYRGITGDIAKAYADLKPGSIITDKGFSSTSLLREKAEFYAKQVLPSTGSTSEHQVMLEILNPTGTQGVNVEAFFQKLTASNNMFEASAPSTTRTQYEWLLPHGSRFEVLSNDGKTIKVVVR